MFPDNRFLDKPRLFYNQFESTAGTVSQQVRDESKTWGESQWRDFFSTLDKTKGLGRGLSAFSEFARTNSVEARQVYDSVDQTRLSPTQKNFINHVFNRFLRDAGSTAVSVSSEHLKILHSAPQASAVAITSPKGSDSTLALPNTSQAKLTDLRTTQDWADYFRKLDKTYPDDQFTQDMTEFGNFARTHPFEAKAAAGGAIPRQLLQYQMINIRIALGLADPHTLPNNSIPDGSATSRDENIVRGSRPDEQSELRVPNRNEVKKKIPKKNGVPKSARIKSLFVKAPEDLTDSNSHTVPKAFGNPKGSAFNKRIVDICNAAEDYAYQASLISNGRDSGDQSLKEVLLKAEKQFAEALSFYRGADLNKFSSFDKRRMDSTYFNLQSLRFHTSISLELLKTLDGHFFGTFRAIMDGISKQKFDEPVLAARVQPKVAAEINTDTKVDATNAQPKAGTQADAASDSSTKEKSLPEKTAFEIIKGLEHELKRVSASISKLNETDVSKLEAQLKETFKDLGDLAKNDQFFQSAKDDKAKVDWLARYVILLINISKENTIDKIFKDKAKAEEVRLQLQEYSQIINQALLEKIEAIKHPDEKIIGFLTTALNFHFELKS